MQVKRYIIVQAVQSKNNELIPVWDSRIIYEKSDMYGELIRLKDQTHGDFTTNLVECVYDLKTHKLSHGIELDYIPANDSLEFKVGEAVFYDIERVHRTLGEATIKEIVFDEYDAAITRGRKMDAYWVKYFKDVAIDGDAIYVVKSWKPFYLLDNGITIKYTHQLYHKSTTNP